MRLYEIPQLIKSIFLNTSPSAGAQTAFDPSDRMWEDVTRGLRPEQIDAIFSAANAGDTIDQARFALELPEKSSDIGHALQTRVNAVCSCEWDIVCEERSATAKAAIGKLTSELQSAGFDRLIRELMSALLPGYALQEIIWGEGGKIEGFRHFPPTAVTFSNSESPLLLFSNIAQPQPLIPVKIIYHRMSISADPCRGGLIRPLGWLYCFTSFNLKDLLTFIERYGQPFLLVKAASALTDIERNKLAKMIRSFGSAGGGLVSGNADASFLSAPNTTGDIYFNFLRFCGDMITKNLLGQTASSGDASGWSKGSAQAQVRQDLLEADCRGLEETISTQLIAHWQRFNAPQLTSPLRLEIKSAPPADDMKTQEALKMKADAIGVAVRAGGLTPCPEIEAIIREAFGLPEMSSDVMADWAKAGNARAPITLAQQAGDPSMGALPMSDAPVRKPAVQAVSNLEDEALTELVTTGAMESWFGPVNLQLDAIAQRSSDEALDTFLQHPDLHFGDSTEVEKILVREAAAGMKNGAESVAKGGKK